MIYLDNAATSRYKPHCVKRAVKKELNRSANPGRSSHAETIRAGLIVEKCRQEIADRFFDGNVIFTKNCTEALNLGILGSTPDRQVITTVYEHNSVLRPLKMLADRGNITLKIIDHSDETELKKALSLPTSLVVMSAMSNVTGKSFDIGRLCRTVRMSSDAKILVDMAQAAGHVVPDLSYADMCAFAGHKALHGVQGTGFLLVRKKISLRPLIFGGTGTSSFDLRHPNTIPDGMEAGTLNTPGIAALVAGIDWTYRHIEVLRHKTETLTDMLMSGLAATDGVTVLAAENGIVLFVLDGISPDEAADYLDKRYKIEVRSGLHCAPLAHKKIGTAPYGAVRISIGANNDEGDIIKTIDAIKEAVTNCSRTTYNGAKEAR